MARTKLSLECPEVNGFLARVEEELAEGNITVKAAKAAVRDFRKEHLSTDGPVCPVCCPEKKKRA